MPDWILNSKVLTIAAVVIIVGGAVAWTLGYITESIFFAVLGFAGFGGMAAFRDWIDSQGYKTYIVAGIGILGTIALVTGNLTPETFIAILTMFTGAGAATLAHGFKKAPVGAKLKIMKVAA